jgi:murein DD-endopeptidase MepM/ murein hydrolase activator NlpD
MKTCQVISVVLIGLSLATTACSLAEPDDEEVGEDDVGGDFDQALSAATAFCTAGFSFDVTNQLCVSATEAVGPFPRSMIDHCKRFVTNRPDGSNSCETKPDGTVTTRWAKSVAIGARDATLQGQCAAGTAFDASVGYCSDGGNIYGPFSKDDVAFCQSLGGGLACETNRVHPSFAKKKASTGEWAYILSVDHGVRNDGFGEGHFGAARSNSAGTHSGIDFLAPVGATLRSACDSAEVQTGVDGGYGKWVQIVCAVPSRLTGGTPMWASTFYAHMNTVTVSGGDRVTKGQAIGTVGKTGNASSSGINAHVHWEVTIHGSQAAARADGHASSDNSGSTVSAQFETAFRQACITPSGIRAVTGPVMRGRRPDPYLMLICTAKDKPALTTPSASLQGFLERWSRHFSATAFDINVGR